MLAGLDFGGCIANSREVKSNLAQELYGVEIHPRNFDRAFIFKNGVLTEEQYLGVMHVVYETPDLGLSLPPIEGALENIARLQKDGYGSIVVTSRRAAAVDLAQHWLQQHGLDVEVLGVDKGTDKARVCRERRVDIFVDDDVHKLEPLREVVLHRFLYLGRYNRYSPEDAARVGAMPAHTWNEIYTHLTTLCARKEGCPHQKGPCSFKCREKKETT